MSTVAQARPAAGCKYAVVLVSPHGRPLCIRHEQLTLAQALFHAGAVGPNLPLILRQADLAEFEYLPSWIAHLVGIGSKGGAS